MPLTRERTTHLAGPPVMIGGRTIQRCPWCGYKLCDSKGASAPLNPDGSSPTFPTWKNGALVEVQEVNDVLTRSSVVGDWYDAGDLPANLCYDLVE